MLYVVFVHCTAFGFCEFEDPEATLRCMRLLNDWHIADKKLVVSVTQICGLSSRVCQDLWHGDIWLGLEV